MNPPLRTKEDVEAVKEGLRDGTIDVIATDHAPHSFDEKEVEYQVCAVRHRRAGDRDRTFHDGAASGRTCCRSFSSSRSSPSNPRRILGLPPIRIAEGAEANLTIFDPAAGWIVDPTQFKSLARNTPFGGFRLVGKPIAVLNHGQSYWAST